MHTEKSPDLSLAGRVLALVEAGVSKWEIAEHLSVPVAEVERLMPKSGIVDVAVMVESVDSLPFYGSDEAAGIDLRALGEGRLDGGARMLVRTGLIMALPKGTFGLIAPRSGLALKHGITVLNSPGIIDSDYRGDIGVILHNTDAKAFYWQAGDRIAQMIVLRHLHIHPIQVDQLRSTDRGAGGFGSTGVGA